MHGFDFIPALHQDINHNPNLRRRTFETWRETVLLQRKASQTLLWHAGFPDHLGKAKFDNSGGLVSVNLSA